MEEEMTPETLLVMFRVLFVCLFVFFFAFFVLCSSYFVLVVWWVGLRVGGWGADVNVEKINGNDRRSK